MVGILPFTGPIPPQSKLLDESQPMFRPLSGVRFAGEYRFSTDEGKWEIKDQQRFSLFRDVDEGSVLMTGPNAFVSSISVQLAGVTDTGAQGNVWALRNGSATAVRIYKGILVDGNTLFHGVFPTPLSFPLGVFIEINAGTAGSGAYNVAGFTELQ